MCNYSFPFFCLKHHQVSYISVQLMSNALQLFEATRLGNVMHVIYFVVFREVLLSSCWSVRFQEKPPPFLPPIRDHLSMCARQRYGVSCEGKYLFIIPQSGEGGGVYILEHLWNTPPCKLPPEYNWSMMNGILSCILIQGDLLLDRSHLTTRQMVKILMLGIEFSMVTAIWTSGHTRGRW